jgi:hypothetical protein
MLGRNTHFMLALLLVLIRALMTGGRILPSVAFETAEHAARYAGRSSGASGAMPPPPLVPSVVLIPAAPCPLVVYPDECVRLYVQPVRLYTAPSGRGALISS